jgi:hypothetical protein
MTKFSKILTSLKYTLNYGYAMAFFTSVSKSGKFVRITQTAVENTHGQDKAGDMFDRAQMEIQEGKFTEVGFHYRVDRGDGRAHALIISADAKADDGGLRISKSWHSTVSRFPFTKGSTEESTYLKDLDDRGIYLLEVEDKMLTKLPIELILGIIDKCSTRE